MGEIIRHIYFFVLKNVLQFDNVFIFRADGLGGAFDETF